MEIYKEELRGFARDSKNSLRTHFERKMAAHEKAYPLSVVPTSIMLATFLPLSAVSTFA